MPGRNMPVPFDMYRTPFSGPEMGDHSSLGSSVPLPMAVAQALVEDPRVCGALGGRGRDRLVAAGPDLRIDSYGGH